ncbi:MAG: hypothetical protein ACSHXD_06535 [Marinosulfonomonas sp.]
MKLSKTILLLPAVLAVSACEGSFGGAQDKSYDYGIIDSKPLSQLQAGVWIDPNGCDHWIIDDGAEGYLSQRLDRNGKPVCSGAEFSGNAIGDFKRGSEVPDPV